MITKNKLILAKIEGSYAAATTPDTTNDFIPCHNIKVSPVVQYNETLATDVSLSPRAGTLGIKTVNISFDHQLQMNTTTEEEPSIEPLLLACGYYDSSAGVFLPETTSANIGSCTNWVDEDGICWKIAGCRGNATFNFKAGEPVIVSFAMQGRYDKPTDIAFPTTVTDLGGAPVVAMNQAFVYNSLNPVVESLSFSLNNTLAVQANMDDAVAHGAQAIIITDRDPSGSFNPEVVLAATTPDYWTYFEAVTQKALTYVVSDSAANTLTVSLPKTEIMNITPGDLGGISIYDIPFKCVRNSGDDEISLTFA